MRLVHAFEKLARVPAEGLDVAPLAFRINGVEGERRFAGTAQAGHDDEFAERQIEVESFQIVLSSSANVDVSIVLHLGVGNSSRPFDECNGSQVANRLGNLILAPRWKATWR